MIASENRSIQKGAYNMDVKKMLITTVASIAGISAVIADAVAGIVAYRRNHI